MRFEFTIDKFQFHDYSIIKLLLIILIVVLLSEELSIVSERLFNLNAVN